MFRRITLALVAQATFLLAVDVTGTWKLNIGKSTYKGLPAPKELIATYTPDGPGWRYEGKGVSSTGEPINTSFRYLRDNAEITVRGFPYWDAMILRDTNTQKATASLMRQGKVIGKVTRTISADGTTMTLQGDLKTPEEKKASYTAVYEKQE